MTAAALRYQIRKWVTALELDERRRARATTPPPMPAHWSALLPDERLAIARLCRRVVKEKRQARVAMVRALLGGTAHE